MGNTIAKQLLLDTLKFWQYKIERDECSMEEVRSVADTISENISTYGTIQDLADFYGQSESNVRLNASRHYAKENEKPKRKVLYNAIWFFKNVPKSWGHK